MFDTIVPRNIRLAEAPSHGLPISEYDKFSKGSQAYKKLAREIEKRLYK
jgi:chromosome partitioning protein